MQIIYVIRLNLSSVYLYVTCFVSVYIAWALLPSLNETNFVQENKNQENLFHEPDSFIFAFKCL